ncbi:hydantoinase B/oxoprolinase family protein [Natrinema gelatinilyticum]|uniref:hydantoinase B/oxoprolinase family protein n=1 Tax=Natrinema gelatinilyticum TaxID=2961571 RepID=UPI0020C288E5|nr:hydantoinase B/oxoprolinase family protein [Natrinema gelatinilyticum]
MSDTDADADVRIDAEELDPITFTVLWDRLVAMCNEMGKVLQRTGKSEAVSLGQDFSTGLFDRDGRVVAQGNFSPGHLGSMPYAVQHVRERYDYDDLKPGDGILLNDSYMGSGHLPDMFLITPVFVDDRIEGFSVTIAHHIDVGGRAPGSQAVDATEIYQEGLRLFPTKVISEGELEPWFEDLIEANVRLPEKVIGDLKAQQNANHHGTELFREVFDEYGRDTVYTCIDEIIDQSEQRVRADLREMPDGKYSFSDVMDNVGVDSGPVELEVTIEIDDDELIFDYSGTDPQTQSAINSYINYTRAYSAFVLKAITEKYLPQNEGIMRPMTVRAPEGSFLNPEPPAAANARPIINQRIVELNLGAVAKAVPKKVVAASSHFGNPNFGGTDPETGERFILYDFMIGGVGASDRKDGEEGICSSFNVTNIPVELHETRYPVVIDRLELIPDSGGAGRHRGGLGLRKDFTLLAEDVSFTNLLERTDSQPWGLNDGEPGDRGRTVLNPADEGDELHPKGEYDLSYGDTVSFQLSGAGGYGDPLERKPEAVLEDVRKEYITREHARVVYGVVFDEDSGSLQIDYDATETKREELAA